MINHKGFASRFARPSYGWVSSDTPRRPGRFLALRAMASLISFDEALALGELSGHEEIGDLIERA